MHPELTQIHLLQPMNTYLKKTLAALHSLYLHLANIPTYKTLEQHLVFCLRRLESLDILR